MRVKVGSMRIVQGKKHLWCWTCQRDLILEVGTELGNLRKMGVCVCVCRLWFFPCVWTGLAIWPFSCSLKLCVESCFVCDYDQHLSNVALLTLFAWMLMRLGKKVTLRKTEPLAVIQKVGYYHCCIKSRNVYILYITSNSEYWTVLLILRKNTLRSNTANSKWFA